jgi:hypothetical protein
MIRGMAVGDWYDVLEYRDMLVIVRDRVAAVKGQSLAQVKAARPTLDYDARWGAKRLHRRRLRRGGGPPMNNVQLLVLPRAVGHVTLSAQTKLSARARSRRHRLLGVGGREDRHQRMAARARATSRACRSTTRASAWRTRGPAKDKPADARRPFGAPATMRGPAGCTSPGPTTPRRHRPTRRSRRGAPAGTLATRVARERPRRDRVVRKGARCSAAGRAGHGQGYSAARWDPRPIPRRCATRCFRRRPGTAPTAPEARLAVRVAARDHDAVEPDTRRPTAPYSESACDGGLRLYGR